LETVEEIIMASKNAKDLVAQANKEIETLTAEEAVKLMGKPGVVFVDVREGEELQKTGVLKDAVHVPRGFLEFQADPESSAHKSELSSGNKLILYCGSGSRSALATKTLQDMGIGNVAHVSGGFAALRKAGAILNRY
jgi:rhodanese-related sulfurtransferase